MNIVVFSANCACWTFILFWCQDTRFKSIMDSGLVKLCLNPRGGTCRGRGPTELYIATQKGFHPQLLLTFDTIIELLINLFSFLVDAISLIAEETENHAVTL